MPLTRQTAPSATTAPRRRRAWRSFVVLPGLLAGLAMPGAHAAETAQRGPDVTLIEGEERTIYEYRQNGQLRLVKIIPRNGRPYFLAPLDPSKGFGDFDKADFVVPQWEIVRF